MDIKNRFQLYLLLLIFGMCALLLQTGIPETWQWKSKLNLSKGRSYYDSEDKFGNDFEKTHKKHIKDFSNFVKLNESMKLLKNSNRHVKNKLPYLNDLDVIPPWSYERFMANMTTLIKSRNHKEFNKLIRSALSPLKTLPVIESSQVTRILLVTYFRSGSTFVGDLLQQNWKSFYTFEPLHYMTNAVRIDDDRVDEALDLVDKIFRCDYNHTKFYINWVKKPRNQFLFKWNRFLWSICRFRLSSCFDCNFIEQACLRAKVQIIKAARLHMRQIQLLLTKKLQDLNVHVVYLVRDPRGMLSSRKKLSWCTEHYNCTDIETLCSEMREDLDVFKSLHQSNPNRFTLIRYEDLSINPNDQAKLLFTKLNIPFSPSVKRYLKTHTNASTIDPSKRNPYTTTRNSKSIAFEWKTTLNLTDIVQVQDKCGDLLTELGYKLVDQSTINNNETVISDNFNLKLN